ncbi:MAG: 3-dehydroquinate synthase [Leptospiraceae bacterium]|nr:3-dehydroquinate synthase [Leptospiraceae bacterium]
MKLKVNAFEKEYPVLIENNFTELGNSLKSVQQVSNFFVISEKEILGLFQKELEPELLSTGVPFHYIEIKGREKNKHISKTEDVYDKLISLGVDRKSVIIALGGGVVGDFSGFIASTILRGIRFVQVPTTLLAAVDSSVGGKVAVNANLGKNMIGAFHQPELVYFSKESLNSLPEVEWRCGLAEVLKHSLLSGTEFFEMMKEVSKTNYKSPEKIEFYVEKSVEFKSSVVKADPKENGLRAILNLGHTMGHAIESYLNYKKLSHGEAVSVGLVTALLLSERRFGLKKEVLKDVIQFQKRLGLPFRFTIKPEEAMEHMKFDKKNSNGEFKFVLLKDLGEPSFGNTVTESELSEILLEQTKLT